MKIPVVLMVYNRPDITQMVMEQLSKAKPPLLYVIADGPKDDALDEQKCFETQKIALNPNWSCRVVPFIQEKTKVWYSNSRMV